MTHAIETCRTPDRGYMGDRRRGASLGRADRRADPDTAGPFQLRRVNLDFQGYDEGGAYWGTGGELWEAFSDDGGEFSTFRLDPLDRGEPRGFDAALAALRLDYPNATATLAPAAPDDFAAGYIEALFFTEGGHVDSEEFLTDDHQAAMREGTADGVLPCDVGAADLAPDTLARIIADCAEFQRANAADLAAAFALEPGGEGYRYGRERLDARRAGQCLWYARNGHGVGFTDDGDAGCLERLQGAARRFGEVSVFFGNEHCEPDSLVHCD